MNKIIAALYGIFFGLLTGATVGLLSYGVSLLYPSATKAVVFDQQDKIAYMVGAVLFAPLFETLTFQMGVIELANHWFKERRRLSLVLSTLLFSALHLFNSAAQARNMIFFGAVLAMIYSAIRKHSVAHAFVATFATHTTHNLLLVLAAILFPQLA